MLVEAVMFSLARSRHALPSQLVFVTTHTIGLVLGILYNSNTPDLYPNNAHHKLGWITTFVVGGHLLLNILTGAVGPLQRALRGPGRASQELQAFIPMTVSAMAEHQRLQGVSLPKPNRHSDDSGHGTEGTSEGTTESVRSSFVSPMAEELPMMLEEGRKAFEEDGDVFEDVVMGHGRRLRWGKAYRGKIASFFSSKVWRVFSICCKVADRLILPLGFVTLCTGIATYARFFVSLHEATPWSTRHHRTDGTDSFTGRERYI